MATLIDTFEEIEPGIETSGDAPLPEPGLITGVTVPKATVLSMRRQGKAPSPPGSRKPLLSSNAASRPIRSFLATVTTSSMCVRPRPITSSMEMGGATASSPARAMTSFSAASVATLFVAALDWIFCRAKPITTFWKAARTMTCFTAATAGTCSMAAPAMTILRAVRASTCCSVKRATTFSAALAVAATSSSAARVGTLSAISLLRPP